MLGPNPLHMVTVGEFVTSGVGFTVTVIVNDDPVQPKVEPGVTMYCTVPEVALLGLVNT